MKFFTGSSLICTNLDRFCLESILPWESVLRVVELDGILWYGICMIDADAGKSDHHVSPPDEEYLSSLIFYSNLASLCLKCKCYKEREWTGWYAGVH